jgi:4'-phosphopantetheinyl transferase
MAGNLPDQWSSPPETLRLPEQTAHVWRVSLDRADDAARRLGDVCAPDERRRASQFHFARDGRRFLVGRGILRLILARYLHTEPQSMRFEYGPYGKPRLAPTILGPSIQFNVSHSAGVMLCALAGAVNVGVDIERVRALADYDRMIERMFSERERSALQSLPGSEQLRAFFTCWAHKEAHLKATGAGLSGSLDQLETYATLVDESPPRVDMILRKRDLASWTQLQLSPGSGFVAALAVEARGYTAECWEWPESLESVP